MTFIKCQVISKQFLCKGIVEAHKGEILVYTVEGEEQALLSELGMGRVIFRKNN